MINVIQSFSQIAIIPCSLVVLDIDETVLSYANLSKKWWEEEIQRNYLQTCNYVDAEKKTLDNWKQLIQSSIPISLDTHNRIQFIQSAIAQGCRLIFLTARHYELLEITRSHLQKINIYNGEQIYFDENKGSKIIEIAELYKPIKNIIVVDDVIKNLNSIHESTKNWWEIDIHLYHINHPELQHS